MSFINVFGGGTLQPTDVSYRAIALAANTTLVWPINSVTGVDYVARVNDVTPAGAGLTITMPPANQISTGFDMLFRNLGAGSFNVLDNGGNVILTVAAGTMQLLYLTNNTTVNGAWGSITFGAGSAAINVASVAGLGLIASGAQLMSATTTSVVSAGPVAIDNTYRATALIWTGGTGTFNLQQVATATNTFWMEVRNQGTGSLTIAAAASEFIDGTSTIVLQPTESCFVHAGVSANWYTVGRGRSTSFEFTELVKTVTGGTATLSLTEGANVVQKYQGALLSNQTVVLPAAVQVYYVQNATSGAFTLTFQSPTPGTVVTVPSGQNAVLFCDGTNVINASTTVAGITSLLLNQGTVTSPSIGFVGNSVTGIYQPLTNTVAITCNGVEVARFTTGGLNGVLGATTPAAVNATTISASGQIQSTLVTGTAPFVVASTTPVANLNAAAALYAPSQYADATGTSDAVTAAYPNASSTLVDGYKLAVGIATPNTTTAPTFAPTVGGVLQTARTIVKFIGNTEVALAVGDLQGDAELRYDSVNLKWVLQNPALANATVAVVSTTIASGATGTTQATGDNSTKVSTTAFVQQEITARVQSGNPIINGAMQVSRGSSITLGASMQYGLADRWAVNVIGGTGISGSDAISFGNAGVSSGNMYGTTSGSWTTGQFCWQQRIIAKNSFRHNGKIVTVSARVYHNTGGARSFNVQLCKANSVDNFSAVTVLQTVTASQSVPNGAITTITATFAALGAADASNGLAVLIYDSAANTVVTKTYLISDVLISEGPFALPYPAQNYEVEENNCNDYQRIIGGITGTPAIGFPVVINGGGVARFPYVLDPPMRAAPSLLLKGAAADFQITDFTSNLAVTTIALSGGTASTASCADITLSGATTPLIQGRGGLVTIANGSAILLRAEV